MPPVVNDGALVSDEMIDIINDVIGEQETNVECVNEGILDDDGNSETIPESVPTATPPVPASIPAVSPTPGRQPKTTARKKVLALLGPIGSSVLGAYSKGVTFPNLDAEPILASAVSLASPEGQVKAKPALGTSHSKSISIEAVSDPSDHDSESSLSPDVLTPKAKGKRKTKVVGTKKGKKANVAPSKDSQPELDPSLAEPNPEVPLDDLAKETGSEEDPSDASPVASDPKGTTPLAFLELSSKLAQQKGAPVCTSEIPSANVFDLYSTQEEEEVPLVRKRKSTRKPDGESSQVPLAKENRAADPSKDGPSGQTSSQPPAPHEKEILPPPAPAATTPSSPSPIEQAQQTEGEMLTMTADRVHVGTSVEQSHARESKLMKELQATEASYLLEDARTAELARCAARLAAEERARVPATPEISLATWMDGGEAAEDAVEQNAPQDPPAAP
ncbi:uncharacterized protein LOC133806246 [Humulus lupulus]|uniref:uncharacterized protein LOC133806246 n=1 Tax=Humulus lupulus TaxID=3486 RepID=UPI002B40AFA0|nr:uncharacterized protein LOC133806246 [Humulus lupulus]